MLKIKYSITGSILPDVCLHSENIFSESKQIPGSILLRSYIDFWNILPDTRLRSRSIIPECHIEFQ